ncbi:6-pyruvoyl tetrahydropterin synthase family protein [Halogeometricum borinquense]|uniref:6-pyruvoyl tetrahydropterin synthase family protein n=1 Tax=Halogeometricum borinquense TaxID=60847 RepID=A0A6C0UGR5_9EURY|nr:6-pyruvoyl tetrahydropterin synthase family protein [Halogeometricum borinquense]QIB74686.1 6-pyruvoyl tetrahydropterin synthase family protein [Halogeometricum borinquense]QIQ76359.1 6-pyruvoyl tetrahydropterin synthase family protein [Halogeometricum borinquense]
MPENALESEQSHNGSAGDSSLAARAGERVLRIGADRPIRISAGHRLMHHDGKCSRPHGHNYEISVEVTGQLTDEGWIVDKGEVTAVIDEWDHRFLVETGDPLVSAFEASGDADSLVVLDAPPTAEVMAVLLEDKLRARLPDSVSDVAVEVRETGELCASY